MTKKNLIVLVVGIVILLILVGGFSYTYFKNKPVAVTPTPPPQPPSTITFSKDEEKTLSRLMGLPSDQIPGVYKEKVTLYKEKLKNDCIANKETVGQFLVAVKDSDILGNLLNEMKKTTVSMDFIPIKTSPEGKDLGFEIRKYTIFECYNLDKDKFKECQSRLNGIEINNVNAEEAALAKIKNFNEIVSGYLFCKAAEQKDKTICSKFFFNSNYRNDCRTTVGWYEFDISVYLQPNCENLCQKTKEDSDAFDFATCQTFCQAIKTSDLNECKKITNKNSELFCDAFTSLDPNYCQQVESIKEFKQPDGTIVKIDEVASCKRQILYLKAVKEQNPAILDQAKTGSTNKYNQFYFLKNLYFGNKGCEDEFNALYNNYCNLKYSQ